MRKVLVIASLLLSLFGNSVQVHAAQEQPGQEIRQKVSNIARELAPQAEAQYHGAPHFTSIEGTPIVYATNSPHVVLQIGGAFYLLFTYYYPFVHNTRDVWLISESAQGPWAPAHFLPQVIPEIICSQINANPLDPYQVCALPWPEAFLPSSMPLPLSALAA
jgi:hypothetical protein